MGLFSLTGSLHRAVPIPGAAFDSSHGDLSGRFRGGGGTIGGDADRAGSQRRRQDDLHEVVEHQRRPHAARCQLRSRRRPGHGQRPYSESGLVGSGAAAAGGGPAGCHGQKTKPEHSDDHLRQLAQRELRREFFDQLLRHQPARSAATNSRRCPGRSFRRRGLWHAHLAAPRQIGETRAHTCRCDQRDQRAELTSSGRAGRRRAVTEGPGIYLHGERPRATGQCRRI